MIAAVEGPSAAGKTTWCRQHVGDGVVPEYVPIGREPGGFDSDARARHWVEVNAGRWAMARSTERAHGVAVCDGDPLKLHYRWCLARIGVDHPEQWVSELRATRRAFEANRLGLVDLVLVTVPDRATLRLQRAGDPTRRRRSFDLHVRLREPLEEWYRAVDGIDPGRVVWDLPGDGVPAGIAPRPDRSDPALLDALVERLPPVAGTDWRCRVTRRPRPDRPIGPTRA